MRLIDLHVDWLLQYATESSTFPAEHYPRIAGRLGQSEAYLQSAEAAIVACYRSAGDWATRADPWSALFELIARVEAEFSGRILIGPEDLRRWEDEPDGLCWAVLGIEGFDPLIRCTADLARIPAIYHRGVRLFQPVYGPTSLLGGSSSPGDERSLTGLGRDFLDALLGVAPETPGPRPLLDLAHLNSATSSAVLDWFEAEPARADRLLPIYSHGAPVRPGFTSSRAITMGNLGRLRALGGLIGLGVSPPFFDDSDQIRVAVDAVARVPYLGREGVEGIAIGTDFLGVRDTLPGLSNAPEVIAWCERSFDSETALALLRGNARTLFSRLAGGLATL